MRTLVSSVALSSLISLLVPLIARAAPRPSIEIARAEGRLTVTGASPGARLILFGLTARNVRGMVTKQRVTRILTDADNDGVLVYEPSAGIPVRSVFVVVDLATGDAVTVAPAGYELDHSQIRPLDVKKDSDGLAEALEMERQRLEFLLVRPGDGAWTLHAREGEPTDGDGIRDGRLTVLFDRAVSAAADGKKAPKKLKSGDFLVAIDSARLSVLSLTVEP